jgi:tetratricopeptide (TPR) repeat protein
MYKDGKHAEALPEFEKLAVTYPRDPVIIETLGVLLITQTYSLPDASARKAARKRGRDLLVSAEKLGANDNLLKSFLEMIPADGGEDPTFSNRKEVDEAMREGEAAFAKHDYPKAIEMYQRALLFDPKLYEAAVFLGDVYFVTAEQRKAGEWFARAIAINPDREIAYRYWGDSLMKQGRVTEAGDKFVEAYIAEPYNRASVQGGIGAWAQRVNVSLAHPVVEIPTSVTAKENGKTTINLDPKILGDEKGGAGAAWMTYGLVRAGWATEFTKQYPNEKTYRHSLKEEAAAMRAALKVLGESEGKKAKEPDPSLVTIAKLDREGLLEAFILLAMPDRGIIQDFPEYRRTNIDKLRRYVNQYVMTGGGK